MDMLAQQLGLERKVDPEVERQRKQKELRAKNKDKRDALDRERRLKESCGVWRCRLNLLR